MMTLLLLLLACAGPPESSVRWRESWEILGLPESGGTLDAEAARANTGLLRGQGHLRFMLSQPNVSPILYASDTPPQTTRAAGAGLQLDADTLSPGENGAWLLRFSSGDASASLQLRPRPPAPASPFSVGREADGWTVTALLPDADLAGQTTAARRGGLTLGRAVLLHRAGTQLRAGPRITVLVATETGMIGLHQEAGLTLAWADGAAQTQSALELLPRGGAHLRVGETEVQISRASAADARQPLIHLLLLERMALSALDLYPERRVWRGLATVTSRGLSTRAPALLLVEDAAAQTAE